MSFSDFNPNYIYNKQYNYIYKSKFKENSNQNNLFTISTSINTILSTNLPSIEFPYQNNSSIISYLIQTTIFLINNSNYENQNNNKLINENEIIQEFYGEKEELQ